MKKQLFLTSSVHAVAHDIAIRINLSKGNKLVFINTPAEPKHGRLQWLINDRKALIKAGFNVTDYTITGKNKRQLKEDLMAFDYIYISGGNPIYFLQKSQESGFSKLVKDLIVKHKKNLH